MSAPPDVTPRGLGQRLSRIGRVFGLIGPHKRRFAGAVVTLFVGSGLGLLYPQAVRWAIDTGIRGGSTTRLDLVAAGLIFVFILDAVLTWLRHYLMSWLGERAVSDLRRKVFDRLITLPVGWFHERRTGELTGRLASDVTTVESVVGTEISLALRAVVQLIGGIVLLFITNWRLTLAMLAIVPPLVAVIVVFGRRIRRMSKDMQDSLADTSAHVQETVGAIQTVQAFVREPVESNAYGTHVERAFQSALRLARWRGAFMSTAGFLGFLVIAIVLWLGGRAVIAHQLTGGELVQFILYTVTIAFSLGSLSERWTSLERAAGATERLFEIIETVPLIRDPDAPEPLPAGRGAVHFEDVSFRYATRPDQAVLQHVDITVAPGEVVALVGPSGSGKTTLTALLLRFHDVTQGRVTFEGVDVRKLSLAELRHNVGLVSQEPILVSGTIAENIAYGRVDATKEEIERAAKLANAHDFVVGFPDGYKTLVGERGVQLSGGQRQRIAIARAVLMDPRVLVLDEATSNLDAESEALVQDALARLMKGRTTLVIAHRLSTVRDADRIVVLSAGKVAEVGSHDELMRSRGVYARLVEHQIVGGVIDDVPPPVAVATGNA